MRRKEGRTSEAEGASSPALSNLWELAPLITMTTGVGAAVFKAVMGGAEMGKQEIPLLDWGRAKCLFSHPQPRGQDSKPLSLLLTLSQSPKDASLAVCVCV